MPAAAPYFQKMTADFSFAVVPLVMFTGSREKMGEFVNGRWLQGLSWFVAVLIAGLNDAHRTEVTIDNVAVRGISAGQVHLAFADVTLTGAGANFDVSKGNNVKVMDKTAAAGLKPGVVGHFALDACEKQFLPYR